MTKRRLITALRLMVSTALIIALIRQFGAEALLSRLAQFDLRYALLAAAAQLAGIVLSAVKWRLFLAAEIGPASLPALTRFYLIGSFFNNFLPSSVGGDVVRAWQTAAAYGRPAAALRSILLERLTGVAAILFCALGALPFLAPVLPQPPSVAPGWMVAGLCTVLLALALSLALGPRIARRYGERLRQSLRVPPALRRPQTWALALMLSLIFQINVALIVWLVGRGLGVAVGFWPVLLCMPLISLLTMLPLTVNGFGLREGAFVALFGLNGVPAPAALAWSLAVYLTVACVSLVGGVLYALQPAAARRVTNTPQ